MAKRFHFSDISPPDLSGSRKHSDSVLLDEYPAKALILRSVEFEPTVDTVFLYSHVVSQWHGASFDGVDSHPLSQH
jgi:hypothetical protein